MNNFNPCPFCNSENLEIRSKTFYSATFYAVYCKACGMHGPMAPETHTAETYWNTLPSVKEFLRLDTEADWLAKECAKFCSATTCVKCRYAYKAESCPIIRCKFIDEHGVNAPLTWRKAAPKAVEAQCSS